MEMHGNGVQAAVSWTVTEVRMKSRVAALSFSCLRKDSLCTVEPHREMGVVAFRHLLHPPEMSPVKVVSPAELKGPGESRGPQPVSSDAHDNDS